MGNQLLVNVVPLGLDEVTKHFDWFTISSSNHHLIGLKLRNEAGFEPGFKHGATLAVSASQRTRPFDGERCLKLSLTVRCNRIEQNMPPLTRTVLAITAIAL